MNKTSPCAPSSLRAFDLRRNTHNRDSIHHRLGRANSERAAQQMPGAYLLPPSLTLPSGRSIRNFKSKPTISSTDCITDAIFALRSSKRRRRHSKRNLLYKGRDDSETSVTSIESDLSSDESDSSVGSMENHPIHPSNTSKKNTNSKSRRKPFMAGPCSPFASSAAAHMDSNHNCTIGILPAPQMKRRRSSNLPFSRHSGANIHSDFADLSVASESREAQELRVSPHHRKCTATMTPKTLH